MSRRLARKITRIAALCLAAVTAILAPCSAGDAVLGLSGYFDHPSGNIILGWSLPAFSGSAAGLRVMRQELYSGYTVRTNLPLSANSFIDTAVTNWKFYQYRIDTVNASGTVLDESFPAEVTGATNGKFDLFRFTDNTASLSASGTISFLFGVTGPGRAIVTVLSTTMDTVKVLADDQFQPGTYPLSWDCRNADGDPVAPGFYVISVGTPAVKYSAVVAVLP